MKTVWHTNVISYVRLAQVQLPTLLIGALAGATQVGAYKIGTAAGCIPAKLLDPAQMAVLPRISRLWAVGRFADIGRLVRHASYISVAVTAVAFALLAGLLGDPVLRLLGGSKAVSTGKDVLIVSAVSFSLTAALFWNGAVLFAAGRARLLSRFYLFTGVAQCVLLVPLVVAFGAVGAAIALLVSTVLGNVLTTVSALKCLRQAERVDVNEYLRPSERVLLSRS
jgi:O-antigen/teichoic acid export membrane protein